MNNDYASQILFINESISTSNISVGIIISSKVSLSIAELFLAISNVCSLYFTSTGSSDLQKIESLLYLNLNK